MLLQNLVWDGSIAIIELFARLTANGDLDDTVTDLCHILENIGNSQWADDFDLAMSAYLLRRACNLRAAASHLLLGRCTSG